MIFLSVILFILGLGLLIKGATWLVDGASSLALRFHINPIVVGLTIVAFGTSSPELVVSVTGALSGKTDIALGNIIGSNIFNLLVILGISALIRPLHVQKNTVWKEIPMSFLGAIVLTVLGVQTIIDEKSFHHFYSDGIIGSVTFSNGLILLSFFIVFLYYTFGISKVSGDSISPIQKNSWVASIFLIFAGLIGLAAGSTLFVDNAVILAQTFGLSERVIGLTIVAAGTSMPELMTSAVAANKGKVELAVGNIVGSNIFNIFFILGITSLIHTIPLTKNNLFDIGILFFATLLLFLFLFVNKKHQITKFEGVIMVIIYVGYLLTLLTRV